MKKISVRIPTDLLEQAKEKCPVEKATNSDVIRWALEVAVGQMSDKPARLSDKSTRLSDKVSDKVSDKKDTDVISIPEGRIESSSTFPPGFWDEDEERFVDENGILDPFKPYR